MDEIKALKSDISTLSPPFNNQLVALELIEVKDSPQFEETLPEGINVIFQEIRVLVVLS